MKQILYQMCCVLVDSRSTSSSYVQFCCEINHEFNSGISGGGTHFQGERSYVPVSYYAGKKNNRLSLKAGQSQPWNHMSSLRRCVGSQSEVIPDEMELQLDTQKCDDSLASAPGPQRNLEMQAEATKKIRQLAKSGNLAQALAVMDNLQAAGVQPDAMAATALVDCCVRCKNLPEAERVFESLFETTGTLRPDGIAVAVLVRGLGAASPPQWIKIQRLLARLENEYFIKLTVPVYNELLDICVKTNDMDKGAELLDKMHAKEISPDFNTMEVIKRKRILRSHLKKVFADRL